MWPISPPYPGDAGQGRAIDDHAAADADRAPQEDDVLDASGCPAPILRDDRQVGLVGERDRDRRPHRHGEALAQRFIAPAEVRGHEDEPVAPAHDADDGHADPDERVLGGQPVAEGGGQLGQVGRDVIDARPAAPDVHPNGIEDLAAEADGGRRQLVDRDLQAEDDGPVRVRADQRRRPARRAVEGRSLLGHETAGDEVPDERADGAAGQAGVRDEVGARGRTGTVEFADDGAQIRAANRLAAVAQLVTTQHHRVCVPLFQMFVRDSYNRPAMSSFGLDLVPGPGAMEEVPCSHWTGGSPWSRVPAGASAPPSRDALDGAGRSSRPRLPERRRPRHRRRASRDRPTFAIPLALRAIADEAAARFGRLDILIVNAGVGAYGPILDLADDHLEEMIDVNVKGAIYAVRAALPHLMQSDVGELVTIASEAGRRGLPNEAVYCASKFAQVGLTRALDHELREHGIRCTNVCPGGVATDFAMGRGRTPDMPALAGMMQPEDVAETVMFVLTRPRTHRILEVAHPARHRTVVGLMRR